MNTMTRWKDNNLLNKFTERSSQWDVASLVDFVVKYDDEGKLSKKTMVKVFKNFIDGPCDYTSVEAGEDVQDVVTDAEGNESVWEFYPLSISSDLSKAYSNYTVYVFRCIRPKTIRSWMVNALIIYDDEIKGFSYKEVHNKKDLPKKISKSVARSRKNDMELLAFHR